LISPTSVGTFAVTPNRVWRTLMNVRGGSPNWSSNAGSFVGRIVSCQFGLMSPPISMPPSNIVKP